MKTILNKSRLLVLAGAVLSGVLMSSSHREAPLISNDPLADNTDLYVFRSPSNPNKVVIIANYIPGQLPQGGPNYYSFGENVRYEIHVDNDASKKGDDIVYRFSFNKVNEDPTTFFNIRLGKQNLKTTYTLERSMDGGKKFTTIVENGPVPPPNIGPRSISSGVGLGAPSYESLITSAIRTASTGEKVFAGTSDDPFYVDLGGIFDLGDAPRLQSPPSVDGLKCLNVSTLALEIDISTLQKDGKPVAQAANILDGNYVIGVWASASRQKIRVLKGDGTEDHNGPWVQVSRLGMPLTNEAVVPIGYKDYWNSLTPYEDITKLNVFGNFFYNPELALYMDDSKFGGAVPSFNPLRIQNGFRNGQNGLFGLKGSAALNGTALAQNAFGDLLLPAANSPRSVDLWPIFHTGVPNLRPYQLATGKGGNPLAAGKPFINNFLPNGGDMLRLNMAVPVTSRTDPKFNSLGLVWAAVLGLTDPAYNTNANLQFIPNMDGFPNGRRLEDDVTRIELQAVSGVVLAAIGIPYDEGDRLGKVIGYNTGINANDAAFKPAFPYVASPWPGTHHCDCSTTSTSARGGEPTTINNLGFTAPEMMLATAPNPARGTTKVTYRINSDSHVQIAVYDISGKAVKVLVNQKQQSGTYTVDWDMKNMAAGTYLINANNNGMLAKTVKLVKE